MKLYLFRVEIESITYYVSAHGPMEAETLVRTHLDIKNSVMKLTDAEKEMVKVDDGRDVVTLRTLFEERNASGIISCSEWG